MNCRDIFILIVMDEIFLCIENDTLVFPYMNNTELVEWPKGHSTPKK